MGMTKVGFLWEILPDTKCLFVSLSLLVNKLQNKTQRTQLFAEIQTDIGAKQTLKPWNDEGDRKIVIMPPTRVIEFFVKCR